VEWVTVPSHVGIEGNMEADRLANKGRGSSPLYPNDVSVGLASNCDTQSPQKKRKVDAEGNSYDAPLLSTDESLLLIDSLGLAPLYDCDTHTGSDSNSDLA